MAALKSVKNLCLKNRSSEEVILAVGAIVNSEVSEYPVYDYQMTNRHTHDAAQ